MPADSEPRPATSRTWRPLGARIAGLVAGGMLLAVCAVTWWSFEDQTRAAFTFFQRSTLVFLGLLMFLTYYALVRSRVEATGECLRIVNGFRRHEYSWPEVLAVHLPPGAPWATFDLSDGTSIAALGIQGSDGQRARRAVRELRDLINQSAG